ncbi:hypothetical protein Pla175_50530 [Pirellulimonas nuda]|uniref:Thioredoxin domain-containing protein n=1 Tax=Pirellulimonas nuda TaxID=2528009 RepID=A0A518DJH0_9BACT|nr:SCO family protein [Pirellulimonas nuda]QDU91623.1 hypothetical protein Pla175_50530 [Pirellulimonas nuda]
MRSPNSYHRDPRPLSRSVAPTCALLTCLLLGPHAALAQLVEDTPVEMQDVGIDEKRGEQIPLGLKFRDDRGDVVSTADLFNGTRPVLLSLNYSDCPMLCREQLNGLARTLDQMEWSVGKEFDVVSVSIDPLETVDKARMTKEKYVQQYGRPSGERGWRFLIGSQRNITALADAVGFRYKYLPDTREYAHTAATIVCTPDGVVSRYLSGIALDPQTLRLSMVEAADGKVGSALDQFLLTCFVYDHTKGRYAPVAVQIMKVAGGITVVMLAATLTPFWFWRRGGRDEAPPPDSQSDPETSAA